MMEHGAQPFREMITRLYPAAQAAQALAGWDAEPHDITKIVIDMAPQQ
jgi:hypothetical protein